MAGPAVGTKNSYGEIWDGTQWNDPADEFLKSIQPPPTKTPSPEEENAIIRPGESTGHAMLRYGGNELKGFASAFNPVNIVKGFMAAPGMIWKGYTEDI